MKTYIPYGFDRLCEELLMEQNRRLGVYTAVFNATDVDKIEYIEYKFNPAGIAADGKYHREYRRIKYNITLKNGKEIKINDNKKIKKFYVLASTNTTNDLLPCNKWKNFESAVLESNKKPDENKQFKKPDENKQFFIRVFDYNENPECSTPEIYTPPPKAKEEETTPPPPVPEKPKTPVQMTLF